MHSLLIAHMLQNRCNGMMIVGHCSKVGIVGEGPLRDVGFLISEMVQWVRLPPLVGLVVLVDVARLRAGDTVEARDGRATEPRQRPEDGALLLGHLSPLKLVHHLVGLLDTLLGELLRSVLTAKGLKLAV